MNQKIQLVRQAGRGSLTDLEKILSELAAPTLPTPLRAYTVATLPAAASWVGHAIYVSNGAAGQPIVAFSDGTNWLRCDTRDAVTA